MKKLIALLLCLVMVLGLMAGCDKEDGESGGKKDTGIVGEWKATVKASDMEDAMELEGLDAYVDLDDVSMTVYATFDKDGTYEFSADKKSVEKMMITLMEGMIKGMAEEYGMSEKEMLELMEVDSVKDLITDENLDDLLDEMNEGGEYTYEDGVLTIDGEEVEFELKGDTLTIEEDGVEMKFKRQ